MSVYKPTKSPFYWYDFRVNSSRFHQSTKTGNRKEAERLEREAKVHARETIKHEKLTSSGPMTIDIAAGRYWMEVGRRHVCSKDTFRDLARLVTFFGKERRLDQITDADVAEMVIWRSGHTLAMKVKDKAGKQMRLISPSTVNRTTTVLLKGIFSHARRTWKQALPLEPNWRAHMLKEPRERVRQLHDHEADALDAAMRDDYAPWIEFAHLTGWRRSETLLRWSSVIWYLKPIKRSNVTIHGEISTTGKRDMAITALITDSLKSILEPLKGTHPEFVFTYVAQSTRGGRIKGQRYPITKEGGKSAWKQIRAKAGLVDFKFHDLRHDAATKTLKAGGSLKHVQKQLGHTSITTSARYAHVIDDDVAVMTERVAKSRKKSRTKVSHAA